jgi:hypothetical protein
MSWSTRQQPEILALSFIVSQPEKAFENLKRLGGLTMTAVAQATGHTQREVSRWVHGERPIPGPVLAWLRERAVATRLQIEIEYIRERLRANLDHAEANGVTPLRDLDYDRINLAKRSPRGQRVEHRKTVIRRSRSS